jgi:hypothetical protein
VTTTTGAAASNPLGVYYANPLTAGKPNGTGKLAGIWTPLYTASSTTSSTGITGGIGTSNLGGLANQAGNALGRRGPAYTVSVAFPLATTTAGQLQTEAQRVINRSRSLTMKETIKVKAEGQGLVLEGQVGSEGEKRLAENMLRLTPGVRSVENNLQVVQSAPQPRSVPAPPP